MTTINAYFSLGNGALGTDDEALVFPGLTRSEFDHGFGQQTNVITSAPNFFLYGPVLVLLWEECFEIGIRFFKEAVDGVTLTLEHSRVAALGYDAMEKDLLAEKKKLTTMLTTNLSCLPSSTSLGADVFEFSWGGVVSRADSKSTWCGIEIWYK